MVAVFRNFRGEVLERQIGEGLRVRLIKSANSFFTLVLSSYLLGLVPAGASIRCEDVLLDADFVQTAEPLQSGQKEKQNRGDQPQPELWNLHGFLLEVKAKYGDLFDWDQLKPSADGGYRGQIVSYTDTGVLNMEIRLGELDVTLTRKKPDGTLVLEVGLADFWNKELGGTFDVALKSWLNFAGIVHLAGEARDLVFNESQEATEAQRTEQHAILYGPLLYQEVNNNRFELVKAVMEISAFIEQYHRLPELSPLDVVEAQLATQLFHLQDISEGANRWVNWISPAARQVLKNIKGRIGLKFEELDRQDDFNQFVLTYKRLPVLKSDAPLWEQNLADWFNRNEGNVKLGILVLKPEVNAILLKEGFTFSKNLKKAWWLSELDYFLRTNQRLPAKRKGASLNEQKLAVRYLIYQSEDPDNWHKSLSPEGQEVYLRERAELQSHRVPVSVKAAELEKFALKYGVLPKQKKSATEEEKQLARWFSDYKNFNKEWQKSFSSEFIFWLRATGQLEVKTKLRKTVRVEEFKKFIEINNRIPKLNTVDLKEKSLAFWYHNLRQLPEKKWIQILGLDVVEKIIPMSKTLIVKDFSAKDLARLNSEDAFIEYFEDFVLKNLRAPSSEADNFKEVLLDARFKEWKKQHANEWVLALSVPVRGALGLTHY